MHILWTYLRPHGRLAALALLLAAVSQVLALVDPIIFGTIIDQFTTGRSGKSEDELVAGVMRLLALAVLVAVLSRLAKALQEYLTRLVVQKLGTQHFQRRPAPSAAAEIPGVRRPAQRRDACRCCRRCGPTASASSTPSSTPRSRRSSASAS